MTKTTQSHCGSIEIVEVEDDYAAPKQLAWVAATYRKLRASELGRFLVRRLNVYRLLAGFTDKTIVKMVAVAWLMFLVFGAFGFLLDFVRLPMPGFFAIFPMLGALILMVSVWVGSWWRHYRQSEDRARHQVLARGGVTAGIAGRLEVAKRWSARTMVDKAEVLRPGFTARANASRAHAIVPAMFPKEYERDCAAFGHNSEFGPIAVAEHIAATYRRVAMPDETALITPAIQGGVGNVNAGERGANASPDGFATAAGANAGADAGPLSVGAAPMEESC